MLKKKPVISIAVGALPPPSKLKKPAAGREAPASDEEDGDTHEMALVSAMDDFIKAHKTGDPEAMAAAFKDAVTICRGYEEE